MVELAVFCYREVKINTFLGRMVASFAEWWTGLSIAVQHWQNPVVKGLPHA
jgi:hypothetical protein